MASYRGNRFAYSGGRSVNANVNELRAVKTYDAALIVDGDEYARDFTFVVLACALMKP